MSFPVVLWKAEVDETDHQHLHALQLAENESRMSMQTTAGPISACEPLPGEVYLGGIPG